MLRDRMATIGLCGRTIALPSTPPPPGWPTVPTAPASTGRPPYQHPPPPTLVAAAAELAEQVSMLLSVVQAECAACCGAALCHVLPNARVAGHGLGAAKC